MTDGRKIWGLVLTGGRSRRMGTDKALLRRDGETQLSLTVSLLARHLDRVFVSARSDQADDAERAKFEQIVDRYEELGPLAGILTAMQAHPEVTWLIVACDLPNVDDATITHLLRQHDADRAFTAYRSSYDELPEPLCALYPPSSLPIVEAHVAAGRKCPRKMLILADTQLLTPVNPVALDNVNTPEDLQRRDTAALR